MSHLKHASSGHLLHGSAGHLVGDCTSSDCACPSTPACDDCPDSTPAQFHVTFTGISLCAGCVSCDALGISAQISDGSVLDGTYVMSHGGDCSWVAFPESVPCSGTIYASADCDGSEEAITFSIVQIRISATQFRLQVVDNSGAILLFDAIVDVTRCCSGYTVDNTLTECGCGVDGASVSLGFGGTATVTAC